MPALPVCDVSSEIMGVNPTILIHENSPPDITMYETLLRSHEVSQAPRLVQIGAVAEKLKQQERNREDKRQRQIAASRARRHATEKREREDDSDNIADGVVNRDPDFHEPEPKKTKTSAPIDEDTSAPDIVMEIDEEVLPDQPPPAPVMTVGAVPPSPLPAPPPAIQVLSKQSKEVRGHTSFLTLACLLPTI
jgi:tRNA (adenine57-N1/adenine58-N1)-methyltransferase catalytic subunit